MYNEPMYNEKPEPPKIPPNDPPRQDNALAAEIDRIRESIDRANEQIESDLAQIRARLHTQEQERDLEVDSRKKITRTLGLLTLLLAITLFGAAWYAYPILQNHTNLLSQLPSFRDSFGSMGKRIEATEEKLRSWTSEEAGLGKRLSNMEREVSTTLQLARRETREFAMQAGQRLEAKMNQRLEPVLARMGKIESSQDAQQARLEQLRTEVGSMRSETARAMAAMQQENSHDFSEVNQQVAWARRDVHDLSKQVEFDRVDFEVSKNRTREVIPGISVKVMKTDSSYQRVDGFIQMVPDGHTLWVRGQGIEQPISFFSQKENRPYELVFSRVNNGSAVGYLLVPATAANKSTAAIPNNNELPRTEALNQ
jgi:predicted  nucleic acid-binding Zn-ribbon protein